MKRSPDKKACAKNLRLGKGIAVFFSSGSCDPSAQIPSPIGSFCFLAVGLNLQRKAGGT
jgi:hypothetical protein